MLHLVGVFLRICLAVSRICCIFAAVTKKKTSKINFYMKDKLLSLFALLLTMVQGVWADDKADYGVLNGEFSVSAGKKVHFSRGNLRAHLAEVWAWSFATNQYDYVGNAIGNTAINGKGSLSSTDQSVDLFGWSTSSTSYGIYDSEDNSEYSGSLLDWGTNAITNGGSKANIWYTPSQDEWTYLMSTRSTTTTNMPTGTNSDHARYIKAQVASKNGLILFPDNYAHPAGASVSVSSAAYNTANKEYGSFTVNAENWTKMEEAGAVFLPAGGYRHGTGIIVAGSYGAYWSSTTSSDKATSMDFSSSTVVAYDTYRSTGCSVRLVINFTTITYNANGGEGTVESQPKYTGLDRTLSDGTGLSRSGYIFDGWATAADGNVIYGPGATYTEDADVTLYAHWTENTATLTDGNDLSALLPYAGKTCTVTYTRSFTADKASTVCLPFDYAVKTGEKFYTFTGITNDGDEYVATMTLYSGTNLVANTPYLYKSATTGATDFSGTYTLPAAITAGTTTSGDWKFVGTYTTQTWDVAPTGIYGFSAQAANDGITQGEFVKVGAYVCVKPMRCYLKYKDGTADYSAARGFSDVPNTLSEPLPEKIKVRFVDANGEVTGIGSLNTQTGEVSFDSKAWYTLDGVRLNAQPTQKGIYVNNGKKVVVK